MLNKSKPVPDATEVQLNPDPTRVGTVIELPSVTPIPIAPSEFEPQHQSWPVRTPQVALIPVVTWVQSVKVPI
jgi:hypothetical protein